ncbi:MAG: nitroreductase family deazaflavin-dependent oxidoreductase [Myxococcota bacterium]
MKQNKIFIQFIKLFVYVYRSTKGKVGGFINGHHVLLLTTVGRKTGLVRTNPVLYDRVGDDLIMVASAGGAPFHPGWYYNLKANPTVKVELGPVEQTRVARIATPEERPFFWNRMVLKHPGFADYQRKIKRLLPIVVLSPAPSEQAE